MHVAVEKISGESLETQISSREIVKTLQIQIAKEFRGGTHKKREFGGLRLGRVICFFVGVFVCYSFSHVSFVLLLLLLFLKEGLLKVTHCFCLNGDGIFQCENGERLKLV